MNKGMLDMKLLNLSKVFNEQGVEDSTLMKATFIILDFEESGNKAILTKEEGLKMATTMKLKPLKCQYFKTSDYTNPTDHFGSHGVYKEKYRDGGQEFIATNSIAIGVSEEGCYLGTFEKDGRQIEGLLCDFYLWVTMYPNIVGLMCEMYENNIPLYSSCEYVYSDYQKKNGITYPQNCIFEGHCLLCSGENGSTPVEPAYSVSKMISLNEKWNKAVSEVLNKENNSKEVDGLKTIEEILKVYCELSHGDIRSKLYEALSKSLTYDEFNSIWISHYDIFDTYFLYETWNSEEEKYDYYKVNFTKNEDDTLTVDVENRQKVERQTVWVSVNELEKVQNEKSDIETKLGEVETSLNEKEELIKSLNEKVETVTNEKSELETKFNETSDKVISLNSKVEELQPIADKYNEEVYTKSLNEKMEYYKNKFVSVNAKDKFETEEVQELVKKSLNDTESALKLTTMLVDLVEVKKIESEPKTIKELNSKVGNLIPTKRQSVEEKYGF